MKRFHEIFESVTGQLSSKRTFLWPAAFVLLIVACLMWFVELIGNYKISDTIKEMWEYAFSTVVFLLVGGSGLEFFSKRESKK